MMKFFLIPVILISLQSFSQDSTLFAQTDSSTVIVHKDPRLDLLIKKQVEINEVTSREARRIAKGYRLLVINTNKRDEAIEAKTRMYNFFPELKSYLKESILSNERFYEFILKYSKSRNLPLTEVRKKADAYLEKVKKYFPKGVYVMIDVIELKLEADELPE